MDRKRGWTPVFRSPRWLVLAVAAALVTAALVASGARAGTPAGTTVAIATSPTGGGWTVTANGAVSSFGGAPAFGSLAGRTLTRQVVGMAATSDGAGYWLVASDGGVFAFGDARFVGSMGGRPLARPIVGMAATPDNRGYWLVASDGGVFSFGDARFAGSVANLHLKAAVVGMIAAPTGQGYLLAASDGGVFAFGGDAFHGSLAGVSHPGTVTAIGNAPLAGGYRLVTSAGAVYGFHSPTFGSALGQDLVGIAPTATGYIEASASGRLYAYAPISTPTTTATTPMTTAPTTAGPTTTTTPAPATSTTTAPSGGGSSGAPLVFAHSLFTTDISGQPVLADSATYVSNLIQQYKTDYGAIGVNELPEFTVPANQPMVPVKVRSTCSGDNGFTTQIGGSAPIPAGAYTSNAQYADDSAMVIIQPSTHTDWEFWEAENDGDGTWSACSGGKLDTATSDGVFPSYFGMSATGIAYGGNMVTEADVASGVIDHAIILQVGACNGYTAPAVRGDCGVDPGQPPEGTWFRINPSVAMPSGLPPYAQMVFRALQTYGAVVADQAGAVMTQAESTSDWAFEGHSGTDPITASWDGLPEYSVLNGIPWNDLQAIAPPAGS